MAISTESEDIVKRVQEVTGKQTCRLAQWSLYNMLCTCLHIGCHAPVHDLITWSVKADEAKNDVFHLYMMLCTNP